MNRDGNIKESGKQGTLTETTWRRLRTITKRGEELTMEVSVMRIVKHCASEAACAVADCERGRDKGTKSAEE